jgi:hypothetical protein
MFVAVVPAAFFTGKFIHQKHSVLYGYAFPLTLGETDGTQVYNSLVWAAGVEVGCASQLPQYSCSLPLTIIVPWEMAFIAVSPTLQLSFYVLLCQPPHHILQNGNYT